MNYLPRPNILFVDDEPDLLAGVTRTLRSERFAISTASNGAAALDLLRTSGPFAVIVSDLRMPEMDGVTLLQHARECSPDTVRVLFSGQPDLEHAIAAVNKGAIFRFIVKPCPRLTLAMTLTAAVEQHRLITAEQILLEQTLRGSIQALTEVLSIAAPLAFGRATRLRQTVRSLLDSCHPSESWYVEVAAMLSQIACVILPPSTLERVYLAQPLSEPEQAMLERMPGLVEQILSSIPRLEQVREILHFQDKRFDGSGPPEDAVSGTQIPWGARALKLALDLDSLESEGLPPDLAFDTLRGREGWYDPEILQNLASLRKSRHRSTVRELPMTSLRPGMVLAQDVRTTTGALFIARGQEVTLSLLEKLNNFGPTLCRDEELRVVIQ